MKIDALTEYSGAGLDMELEASEAAGLQTAAVWKVEILSRNEVEACSRWEHSFPGQRKDYRYFELVEDTINQGFEYRYFALKDTMGQVRAIQPFFINDQDLLEGSGPRLKSVVDGVRRIWPRFLRMRTLMVGCAAGEGHLDAEDNQTRHCIARNLALAITDHARRLRTKLIVFKEFTVEDRAALACLKEHGFTRAPSMPMSRLRLNFKNFDEYMRTVLSAKMRAKLRRDERKTAERANLELKAVNDITPYIGEIFPLYLAVYNRSALHFEKLTQEYFCRIGQEMPERTWFFLILNEGKIVSFNLCLAHGREMISEYVGFNYNVAFDLNLYNIMTKKILEWAIENGYEWYGSTSLNYEPKYHFRHILDPLDLYVKHRWGLINFFMKYALPMLEPTRRDPFLPKFSNYADLHGKDA
jgi:Peptidogalycan biosysnthesis/recognition